MCKFWLKKVITKNLEDLIMNKKRQSIDANTKMTEISELSDQDLKAAMIKLSLAITSDTNEKKKDKIRKLHPRNRKSQQKNRRQRTK